jgi:CRP-like cAMP-binding protein
MGHDNRVDLATAALERSPVFCDLPRGAIERLARAVRYEEYQTSTLLVAKGETYAFLRYVIAGHLVARIFTPTGESIDANHGGPGQWTSWGPTFVEGYKASRDTWSSADATCLAFPCQTVREIALENPDIYTMVISELTKRQAAVLNFVYQSGFGNNERTLAQLLLSNCVFSDSQRNIELSITQQHIGQIAGCSRKKVSGILKGLVTKGLIELGYGTVTVLDRKALEAYVQQSEPLSL